MQFRLTKTYRYWWPVTVLIPDPVNAGAIIEQNLKVELQPLPQDEWDAAQAELADLKTLKEVTEHGTRQIQRIVTNWEGVVDPAGAPVTFTSDLLAQALQHPWFRAALQKALRDSQNGEAARQGN